ncbi:MAG: TolC family protein [Gemmatimonadota bacterium]
MTRVLVIVLCVLLRAAPLAAQGADTLTLGEVLRASRREDPRAAQLALERVRSVLRLQRLGAERLPTIRASGLAQYQSDVTSIGGGLPDAPFPIPTPSRDTYDARLDLRQPILDPTIAPRRAAEQAGHAEVEAQLEATLHALRSEAIEAFFAAALMASRAEAIETTLRELEAARLVAAARVREGTALASEEATIRAEQLRRRQDADEARAERAAALRIVAELTGIETDPGSVIHAVDTSRAALPDSMVRPELTLFARRQERLRLQERALASSDLPRLTAFGRAGYGRPGLNVLGDEFVGWWLGGLQLEWSPRLWGSEGRERELLRLEAEIVATEAAAFRTAVHRAAARDAAAITRLANALTLDEEIVALRESVERETRLRFEEGVVTSAELVDRSGDTLAARIARATHRLELARARARYRNLMGLEVE